MTTTTMNSESDIERDLGEQPIAQHMRELKLTPAQLVKASTEQLNHKMVQRATKGRRLTGNVMKKVRDAINTASGKKFEMNELFNYVPLNAKPESAD